MDYKIVGADGKEYDPVTLVQMQQWIKEGRINGGTQVMRSDQTTWTTASELPELGVKDTVSSPINAPTSKMDPLQEESTLAPLRNRLKNSASWFYWIAGLSVINSIAALSGGTGRFIFGLGVTQIIDEVGRHITSGGLVIAAILDLCVIGVFIALGVFAHKKHTWAFIVGLVLFGLDTLVYVLAMDWISIAFHAYVLFRLFTGFKTCQELKEIELGLARPAAV